MFTIKNDLNGELIVNKSRFITYVYKVNNVLEVNEKIDALKAKYKDATHYCYSYIIDNIKRFNERNWLSMQSAINEADRIRKINI